MIPVAEYAILDSSTRSSLRGLRNERGVRERKSEREKEREAEEKMATRFVRCQ